MQDTHIMFSHQGFWRRWVIRVTTVKLVKMARRGKPFYHEEMVALDRLEGALYCGVVALGHKVEVETNLLN